MKGVRRDLYRGGVMRTTLHTIAAGIVFTFIMPLHIMAQEREWQLDAQGDDAYLVFGVPNTADIGISLWCKIGEKNINVFAPVPSTVKKPVKANVKLLVEDREYPLKPKINNDQNNNTLEAELLPRDEIFSAIASAERIGLVIADHKSVFPTEGANFFEFNKLCTTAQVSN
jgi:hypothetical protein